MALSRGFRRGFFGIAVLVFAAASYIFILYAQGFSFSFENRAFVLTGALTLDANEQVNVIIDGEYAGSTSVLTHEFNKGRMLPGTYTVYLEREGYSEWSKSVMIQEGLVTDFPNILVLSLDEERASRSRGDIEDALEDSYPSLTPSPTTTPSPTPEPVLDYELVRGVLTMQEQELGTGVRGYQESPDGEKVMWWTRNEVWVMWLQNTDYQPFRMGGDTEAITRLSTAIDRAAFWPSSHHIAIRSGTSYRVVELDTRGGTNIIEL